MPIAIVERLNKESNAGLPDPNITARLADISSAPMPMTREASSSTKAGMAIGAFSSRGGPADGIGCLERFVRQFT